MHSSFCHKNAESIVGPAVLSISMVCNSKILPNIMQINVVDMMPCCCLEFVCCKIELEKLATN